MMVSIITIRQNMSRAPKLLLSILLCLGAGAIGSAFTMSSIPTWYAALKRPSFAPPNWIFGPVWTTLFIMMGVALFLVWGQLGKKPKAKVAAILFLVHLAFNVLWSALFFGLRSPGWAFAEIIVLWGMIAALVVMFRPIDRRASYLMVPYLLWVSFAAVLNLMLWRLNP